MSNIEGNHPPSVSLREYLERLFKEHEARHDDHASAHDREHKFASDAIITAAELGKENKADANEWRETMNDRERKLATKVDIETLTSAVNELKTAEIKRVEAERQRLINEAEDKAESKERQTAAQWRIGIMVAVASIISSVLISLVIRITST